MTDRDRAEREAFERWYFSEDANVRQVLKNTPRKAYLREIRWETWKAARAASEAEIREKALEEMALWCLNEAPEIGYPRDIMEDVAKHFRALKKQEPPK